MYTISIGKPTPLGSDVTPTGVNFSIFSQHATSVELLLFDSPNSPAASQIIPLESKTLFYWHVHVDGLQAPAFYAFRVDGPSSEGHRYNRSKVLIDPYAHGNMDNLWIESHAVGQDNNIATSLRSVVIDIEGYNWAGDTHPNTPIEDTIIYELHVGGFTKSPTANVSHPGTFAGLIEKLPYIKALGVTAIEIMPIFDFDEKTAQKTNPLTNQPLTDYWGYDPYSFFAPQNSYCITPEAGSHISEFRDFVKAAHKNRLEVILDVVFNHSGEGNQDGPWISLKGIDNQVYYILDKSGKYIDWTGCGNTLQCSHPLVAKLIEESLRFWVKDMHVDGFRFDIGSILAVDDNGNRLEYPPAVWAINLDEELADIKVIAEPFGPPGVTLLGNFPDSRWATWNYLYRDCIRQFVRGDRGLISQLASRISASSDQYSNLRPVNSINYLACHDGMTLNDVVSYNWKHNEMNGEQSGTDNDFSWNCGVEGPTVDPAIEQFRFKQLRNFFAILFVSIGVPMILAGDEARRSQQGNNNPWDQDNEISWFNWDLTQQNRNSLLVDFVKKLIAFRKSHKCLRRTRFFDGVLCARGLNDITWHGSKLFNPGFNDPSSRVLAFTIADPGDGEDIHVILNMEDQPLNFDLPSVDSRQWYRVLDTSLDPVNWIMTPGSEVPISPPGSYIANDRTVVVLVSK